jgi:heme exporter protein A
VNLGSEVFAKHRLSVIGINYSVGRRTLLKDVGFDFKSGECLQVTGPNGVGKSTLMRIVAGLASADGGERILIIETQTVAIKQLPQHLLYQGHLPGFKEQFTIKENLELQCALDLAGYQSALSPTEQRQLIDTSIESVGLKGRSDLAFGKLSAGQKRRCMLARLAWNTAIRSSVKPIWLLDEPLTALDDQGQSVFIDLLNTHLRNGGSAMIATHQDLRLLGLTKPLELRLQHNLQ